MWHSRPCWERGSSLQRDGFLFRWGYEPRSEALGKPPCGMVCAEDLALVGLPQAHPTTAHPLSSPALPMRIWRPPRASPWPCASPQSCPMLQRALEPTGDVPSRAVVQHTLSSSRLALNASPEGRWESSLLPQWCLKKKGCSHYASCTNQHNYHFQWQLMSFGWEPEEKSLGNRRSSLVLPGC